MTNRLVRLVGDKNDRKLQQLASTGLCLQLTWFFNYALQLTGRATSWLASLFLRCFDSFIFNRGNSLARMTEQIPLTLRVHCV